MEKRPSGPLWEPDGRKKPLDPLTCAVDPLRSPRGKADQAAHGKSAHQAAPGHSLG